MKSIDDLPYALIGAALATIGFFVGNLVFYQHTWQLVVAPVVGAALGLLAGALALRGKKLPVLATLGDFKEAMKREKRANSE